MFFVHLRADLRDSPPGVRIVVCAVVGAAISALLPASWGAAQRVALGWISAVVVFLVLIVLVVAGGAPERLRARARRQDSSRWVSLTLLVTAAAVSLIGAGLLLQKHGEESLAATVLRIALAGGVVVASWTLTHTMFALHYAHAFYGDGPEPGPDDAGGLEFPGGGARPDFWDFVYFALVIGMTCQVSDVQITSRHLRRLAAGHGVLSFFFNTVILALTINLIVGAL